MAETGDSKEVRTLCRCCVAGCGVRVRVGDDGAIEEVRGDPDHALSRGYICPKAYNLAWHHTQPDLLTSGRIRGRKASWDETSADLADSIRDLAARYGGGVIGSHFGTGAGPDPVSTRTLRALTMALGSRQLYSSSTVDNMPAWVAGDIVTGSGPELQPRWVPEDEDSRLVIFVGCNPIVSHGYFTILPDASRRIRAFRRRGGRVWAVDPRACEIAKAADGHLACLPGTDWLLLSWLLKEVLAHPPHPDRLKETLRPGDVERLAALVAPVTRAMVAERCDVDEDKLQQLADEMRRAGRFAMVTGSGSIFAETGLVNELLRYAILAVSDSLDQPGGIRFDVGYLAKLDERTEWNASPEGGRPLPGPDSRPELRGLYGELPCTAMADEIEAGNLKALIVNGGNPLAAFPDPDRMQAALAKLEILAVVDVVETPLSRMATHVLPGLRQLEASGVTAWNGRAAYAPPAVPMSGDRGPGWRAFARIARGMGLDVLRGLDPETATAEEIIRLTSKAARYDLDALIAAGTSGIELPYATDWVLRRAVPGGRWRIASDVLIERLGALLGQPAPGKAAPLALICRRQNERTNSTGYVREARRRDHPFLLMSAPDADSRGLSNGDLVRITSDVGAVEAAVAISDAIRPGAVSLPHGWAEANVSRLISSTALVDRLTGQAPMSAIPVSVEHVARREAGSSAPNEIVPAE